ncbi:MAG TPA: NAD-binding protein [Bryobacteraceae bacterium]|jgi:voltage-gated potassium channel|nr:NAD-binding protein [Bryobacteraceae bacterium]
MGPRLLRRTVLIAGLLVLTLCIGTVGFHVVDGYSFFDAFYMTLTTITTVGYQELHPLSPSGRVFNSFLILFGVSSMFFAIGVITQTIIELQLQDIFGKRRRRRMIAQLNDHFIVCGFGRVGRNASYELQREKVPFVVVDRNPDRVQRAADANMMVIAADASRDETLREAGVMRAKGLIAALPSDAENTFIILSAKTLNPKLNVVTRASEEEAEKKLRRAGADTVLTPYTMAGHRLAHAAIRPHVVEFLDFAITGPNAGILMEQVRVGSNAEFASELVRDTQAGRDLGVILVAIRKASGDMLFRPTPETPVSAGDVLIVLGEQPNLRNLERMLASVR